MAAPADYLDAADLKAINAGGLVREDVLNDIFDCSDIPTEFLDSIGTDAVSNSYTEWTEDKLAAPDLTNAKVSGSDIASTDNKATRANSRRVGNHAQISTKPVMTSDRTAGMNVIGVSDEMGYQTGRRLQELRRDVEGICLSGQASVADNGDAVAGKSAGAGAWIVTNTSLGAGGVVGGFVNGTKLVTAQTPGEGRGLTMALLSAQIENVYTAGANVTVLMSVPGAIKRLAAYLFTTPYAATPTANVNGTGGGAAQTSQGYIDVMRTDFGTTLKLVPNRLQQTYSDAAGGTAQSVANVYGFDMRYWKLGLVSGWKVDPLAKIGLSDRKLLSVDWSLKCLLERANFMIADINPTVAVVA